MKYMYVIYDCDVCEKHHTVKATWTAEVEMDSKTWPLNMEAHIVASLLSEAYKSFAKIHHPNLFTNSRLMFSQVFEEGEENEEGTI